MTHRKATWLITLDVCLVLFVLASSFAGTMAWFNATRNVTTNASSFSVASLQATIESVALYKFEYKSYVVDGVRYYDYISPAKGTVKTYSFDFGRNEFGSMVDEEWVRVSEMNLYDPDAYRMYGSLLTLNCNAVYKITFSSQDFIDADLYVNALKKTVIPEDNILLSTCADFDVFTLDEVDPVISYPIPIDPAEDENDYRLYQTLDGRPVLVDGEVVPAWHPSYKGDGFSAEEEIYYKISRLASLSSHDNFYDADDPEATKLPLNDSEPIPVTFEEGRYSIYLNVNYAPTQLTEYNGMDMNERVHAVYDYGFSFYFE